MSALENLEPGSIIPKSGYYRCIFCGDGGMANRAASILNEILPEMSTKSFGDRASKATRQYFMRGAQFPQCPNCGPATGWSID